MTEVENIFEESDINLDVEAEENLIGMMARAETPKEAKEAADALKAMQEAKQIKQNVSTNDPNATRKKDRFNGIITVVSAIAPVVIVEAVHWFTNKKETDAKIAISKAQNSLEREELYIMADKCKEDLPNTAPIDAKRKLNRKR